jgi:hypothetical protein
MMNESRTCRCFRSLHTGYVRQVRVRRASTSTGALIDDLLWWTAALKTARVGAS